MKNKILLTLTIFCFFMGNTFRNNAEENTLTDNYRIYEPFNLSDTKNIELSGESVIDFSNASPTENKLDGVYKANYALKSSNGDNSTVKMGITFNSSI